MAITRYKAHSIDALFEAVRAKQEREPEGAPAETYEAQPSKEIKLGEVTRMIVAACDLGENVTISEIKRRTGLKYSSIDSAINRVSSPFKKVRRGVYCRVGEARGTKHDKSYT